MPEANPIVVAMSGGVDSSVAAALLVKQRYQVIGMMLRLWSEPGSAEENRCCSPDSMTMARRIASRLEIPFYTIDAQEIFRKTVVEAFVDGYTKNITPNPCLVCNRIVRWEFLLNQAMSVGASHLATGHYVRLERQPNGLIDIYRGIDTSKDQSYVLHSLTQTHLQHSLFPLGRFTKKEVRQLARDFNLPVAERQDSQDLCFLGAEDYRSFLQRYAPVTLTPGPISNISGKTLGTHQGLAFYTIGQRKGLGISSPLPHYVIRKDLANNKLIVGVLEDLGRDDLEASAVNWISGIPPNSPFRGLVKIRYTSQPAWATIIPASDNNVRIHFDEKMRDITPGQSAVIYDDQKLLGGGIIQP